MDRPQVTLLIAEDDDDDFLLTAEALGAASFAGSIVRLRDGEEILEHLRKTVAQAPSRPEGARLLILLDLNMPGKNGHETLAELKAHPVFRRIPVIVLTNSSDELDVSRCYAGGASSYIRKPLRRDDFIAVARMLNRYWVECVELPIV